MYTETMKSIQFMQGYADATADINAGGNILYYKGIESEYRNGYNTACEDRKIEIRDRIEIA